ncbi:MULTISPECIES: hypothetical protein [Vibrio]|uniref:Type II/III secretion system secretin-like domain-containing protein n=1 Tax=Vibrio tasmaniensis TaxID=212663 RepID=A0A2N7NND3_9VIBR|nr:hypothetical protein [Vibrio tasmaniensis]PMO80317.1 hypothetical protein BCT01_08480 [Vibrio tasmaniensis]PMP17815.1 hypothetical protein BCS92_05250 [Vibrio tasmaniensis]TKG29020.1 hypothetical protein FC057_20250 [Vibrio tasmaniensis]TKG41581.1 hypothetical protein FC063_06900 [Vibrio tasmaniensis]TKG46230.1 hypothetical protein FC070_22365 [Vibrio tasmaniensis]
MNIKHFLLSALTISILSGCSSYNEIEETQSRVEAEVSKEIRLLDKLRKDKPLYRNVVISDSLFVSPIKESEQKKPVWWFEPVKGLVGSDIPLKDALGMVLIKDASGVNVSLGRNVDKNFKVSFKGKTIGDAIESISAASGYSFQIPKPNKIIWSMYETRTFQIATGPGRDYFGQGKGKGESNTDDATINSNTEYVNADGEIESLKSVYEELLTYSSFRTSATLTKNSVQDIEDLPDLDKDITQTSKAEDKEAGEIDVKDIPIYLNQATSTITVRDTPAVLDEMQIIVDERNDMFRTNVYVEIDIIEVKMTNEGQQAFDVAAVIADLGGVAFNSGVKAGKAAAQIGRASTSLPTNIISAELTRGKAAGSKLLAEALSFYGKVSNRTMPRQTMQPNTASKLADFENIYFIKERKSESTANVGTEGSITQDNLDVGFSLYVMPTIFEDDVTMRMATNISSLVELTRNGDTTTQQSGETDTKASYVESPRTSKKDFYSKFTVTQGDTLVLSGLSRETKSIRRGKGVSELLASSEYGNSERIETIITVTPYIFRPRS